MSETALLKLLEDLRQNPISVHDTVWTHLDNLLKECYVPEFEKGNERQCDEDDYMQFRNDIETKLDNVALLIELITEKGEGGVTDLARSKTSENEKNNEPQPTVNKDLAEMARNVGKQEEISAGFTKDRLVSILLLIGENSEEQVWNNKNIIKSCNEIKKIICDHLNVSSVLYLLVNKEFESSNMFLLLKPMLLRLRPTLEKTNWKMNPGGVACFKWLLTTIPSPHLSEIFQVVLPTSLLLVDDYVDSNRVTGILCLQHIIENVTRTSLTNYNQHNVIYKTLEPLLYTREADIMNVLLPTIVNLVYKTDISFGYKHFSEWNKLDDVLEIILEKMELEQDTKMRSVLIQNLPHMIKYRGEGIVRWSRRLFRIITDYREHAGSCRDVDMINYSLLVCRSYLSLAHPLMHLHVKTVLLLLQKTLYDVDIHSYTETKALIKDCFSYIAQFPDDHVKNNIEKSI